MVAAGLDARRSADGDGDAVGSPKRLAYREDGVRAAPLYGRRRLTSESERSGAMQDSIAPMRAGCSKTMGTRAGLDSTVGRCRREAEPGAHRAVTGTSNLDSALPRFSRKGALVASL